MSTFNLTRHSAAVLAVALAFSATGCSSTRNQAALSSLRKFIPSAHSSGLPAITVSNAVGVHRHAREHAITTLRTAQTPHHGTARSL